MGSSFHNVPTKSRLHASSCLTGCAGGVLLALAATSGAQAGPSLPQGGSVASGSAVISSSPGGANINQTTAKAVINWSSFDVGAGNKVVFAQPNAQSATLNRVTGNTSSTIAGQISANGTVYLINPNGIAITSQGSVQTGGGFVASTLGITDADFLAGNLAFTGNGASAGVSNAGRIVAGQGSYVALLGGQVANSGSISVPYGTVGLGSGEQITLDLNGDGFMQVAVPTASSQSDGALIDVSGNITATGGRIVLSAASLANAVRNIINVPGTLNADSATGDGGSIQLLGGEGGTVIANGTLTARATGPSGEGGSVETSGATVNFDGLTVDTSSVNGKTGTWLVDPTNLTVDTTAANTINSNLATTNVTLQTNGDGTTSGPGVTSSGPGDIDVNAALAWSSANTLTLNAFNNIALNSTITAPSGGLTLNTYNSQAFTHGTISAAGAISLGTFTLTSGNWSQVGSLPAFSATNFELGTGTTFLRAAAGAGTSGSPYQITDVYGLQGIAGASDYVLINNIDASRTAAWNAGGGLAPQTFSGNLDGQGWAVSNLTINRPTQSNVGLFGMTSGSISNLTLTNVNVTGAVYVGGLAGQGSNISNVIVTGNVTATQEIAGGVIGQGASVSNSVFNGTVTTPYFGGGLVGYYTGGALSQSSASGVVSGGSSDLGGLVGEMTGGTINQSFSNSNITGAASTVGGLVGYMTGGAINQSFATGSVTGNFYVGGLVGYIRGSSITIDQTYASGAVTGVAGSYYTESEYLGGLVGYSVGAAISRSYATGSVTGSDYIAGFVGEADSGTISSSYSTGHITLNAPPDVYGGFVSHEVGGSIASSYWDTYSSGISFGCGVCSGTHTVTAVTSNPSQSSASNYAYNFSAYSSLTPSDWVEYTGQTRPFGAWEVPVFSGGSATIANGHQLQLINSANLGGGGVYILAGNIDLSETNVIVGTPSSYAGMWASTGFVPIGADGSGGVLDSGAGFLGAFYGLGYAITGLTINRPNISDVGLFGVVGGSISDVRLLNGSVAGQSNVGDLVGLNSGTISQASAGGAVSASATDGGGLVGQQTNGSINQSYATGGVTGLSQLGGLVGAASGATISQVYATGSVTGTGTAAGGLIGQASNSAQISQAYALGAVSANQDVGGLVGSLTSASTVASAYATGAVTGTGVSPLYIGGLLGVGAGGAAVSASYWDSYSTGQSAGCGSCVGVTFSATAVTSDPSQSGAANYAYTMGAYSAFTPSNWVFLSGLRPLGAWEEPTMTNAAGQLIVSNSHQLQLIDATVATLAGQYVLTNNIDLSQTGATQSGSPATYAGIWGPGGFVALGTDGAGNVWNGSTFASNGTVGFSGSLNGQGNVVLGLNENRSTVSRLGLFGYSTGALSNLTLSSGAIVGANHLGALAGGQTGGSITNVASTVNVGGGNSVGGLVGDLVNSSALNSSGFSGSGAIAGGNYVGGLVGFDNNSTVSGSSATNTVTGGGYYVGGLVGYQGGGSIVNATTSGTVNASGASDVGGLVGYEQGAASSISGSTAKEAVSGSSNVGGLIGYSEGAVASSSATGAVSGTQFIGGLIGRAYSGAVSNGAASGTVTGSYYVGGLVGYQDSGAGLSQISASGKVAAPGAASFVGGLVGSAGGSIANATVTAPTVGGLNYVGGLVGYQSGGAITGSSSSAAVTGTGNYVGGLIGSQTGGSLSTDQASGPVSGVGYVGGLVGYQTAGSISGSIALGKVTGTSYFIGGLVGAEAAGNIDSAYATGNVSGPFDVGGLVGFQDSGSSGISNSYATGSVTPFAAAASPGGDTEQNFGGLVGYSVGHLSNDYATGAVGLSGTTSYVGGLVGRAYGGVITGSHATGAVQGDDYLGGLVGRLDINASLTQSYASGGVTAYASSPENYAGGLVGYSAGAISNSKASGNVVGGNDVGGLVGYQSGGSLSENSASATVTGGASVGGLIGYVASGTLDQGYAAGAVSGTTYVGGLIGQQAGGTITNVYETGNIVASGSAQFFGGLIGYQSGGSLSKGYAIGVVGGSSFRGGVVGYQESGGSITNAVWNTQTSGQSAASGFSAGTVSASGLTTAQMQDYTAYSTNYPGFDFTNIWNPPNQAGQNGSNIAHYPTLKNAP